MTRERWALRVRRAGTPGLLAAAVAVALAACGDTTSQPAWVPAHPDTTALTFQTTAPGLCAITVQYPNDAPAAIGYLGSTYVQVARLPHASASRGRDLGQSGNWHVLLQDNGDLLLATPGNEFEYRAEASC